MKVQSRMLLFPLLVWVALFHTACSPYSCRVTFGSSTCTPSGSGLGTGGTGGTGGGGGSSSIAAFAFAVDQGGTLDGYTLTSGTSTNTFATTTGYVAPVVPTNDGGSGMVIAQSQYLYAGFGVVGQIYGWTISSTGTLTPIAGSPFAAPFLGSGSGVSQSEMTLDPAGANLFVSDPLQNSIYVFQIGTGGVLTAATGSPFTIPFSPMNLTTDGLGKYLYAVDGDSITHTGSQIAAYAVGTGGVLTAVPGSPFAFPMWQVQGEPTGQFLIGTSGNTVSLSGGDDDNLYVFSITQSGTSAGAIAQVTKQPTVYSPFSIAVQSNVGGTFIYSLGFNDTETAFNPLEGYSLTSIGTLTADTGSPFSGVADGSWGQFDQTGTLLFVYASYVDSGTGAVVTQLAPIDVSSGGALTQPVATTTLATPGFWAVTDPQ